MSEQLSFLNKDIHMPMYDFEEKLMCVGLTKSSCFETITE